VAVGDLAAKARRARLRSDERQNRSQQENAWYVSREAADLLRPAVLSTKQLATTPMGTHLLVLEA
jgi:hypothetical protein